jgi:hypothetical protein
MEKEYYKNLLTTHAKDGNIIIQMLEIVKEFIIKKKLIVYGGLAIDYALKLKGSFLYSPNTLPDWDIFSPNHTKDGYELSTILYQKFPTEFIDCIFALHISTMRVRSNYAEIADISYIPLEIFDKIPTLTFNNVRFVDPNYQKLDIHRSLFLPFENAPLETIFNRWVKDIERYNLLSDHYTFPETSITTSKLITTTLTIPKNSILTGFHALYHLYSIISKQIQIPKMEFPESNLCYYALFNDVPPDAIIYEPLLDLIPLSYSTPTCEVYYMNNLLIANNDKIINIQGIMFWLLIKKNKILII